MEDDRLCRLHALSDGQGTDVDPLSPTGGYHMHTSRDGSFTLALHAKRSGERVGPDA